LWTIAKGVRLQGRVVFLLARLIPSLLGLVVAAVLTRVLKPEQYGLYALGLSIIFFLTIGVFEWLGLSLLRMTAGAARPDLVFGTIMTCFIALLGVCVIVAGLALIVGDVGNYASLVLASLFASSVTVWFELRQRLQMAELRAVEYFRMSVGRGLLTTLLVPAAAFAWRSGSLSLFALGVSNFLAGLLVSEKHLRFNRLRFDRKIFASVLRFGIPLSVSVGLATVLMSVDKWLLQALSGPDAVGLFTAAALVTQMPIQALASGVGPFAYSMAVRTLEFHSTTATKSQLAQNFIVLIAIVLPSAAGIVALSDNLAHVIVGQYYWKTVVSLAPWLSAAAVVGTIRAFYIDIAFQLANRTLLLVFFTLLALVVNLTLNIWLIPLLGVLGAAIASFFALLSSSVAATIYSRFVFPLPLPIIDTAKVLTSTAFMFFVVRQLELWSGPWALLWQITIGCAVYTSLLVILNVLNVRGWIVHRFTQLRRWAPPRGGQPNRP
jgi:O-antigen/teichoic acid export membrane protein